MIVCVIEKIEVPGHSYAAGFHEVSPAEFHSLVGIGCVRPATADEVQFITEAIARDVTRETLAATGGVTPDEVDELGLGPEESPITETAEAPPPAEMAVTRKPRRRSA